MRVDNSTPPNKQPTRLDEIREKLELHGKIHSHWGEGEVDCLLTKLDTAREVMERASSLIENSDEYVNGILRKALKSINED